MDASRFDYLLYRFRQDTLEDAELQEWREIVLSGRYDEQLGEDQEAILGHYETHALWNTEKQEHLLEQLHEKLGFEQDDKIISLSRKRTFRWWAAAAIVILAIGMGSYYLFVGKKSSEIKQVSETGGDLMPGSDKAVLTLADGTTIVLDTAKNGLLSSQGNTSVLKINNGQLNYNTAGAEQGEIITNTITTPNGGQYMVVLSDGTKVWLNAASSLKFPNRFTGNERRVTLTGEGYFEVAHNSAHTFIVDAGNAEVQDIGTAFNINAYSDEPSLHVTLAEGLANVKAGGKELKLIPGKMAVVNTQNLTLADADIQTAIAWKNGVFQFHDAGIETVMRQIARWYNVTVEYKGAVNERFNGSIYRNAKASDVFSILSKNANVRFTIEGQKVTVQP